MMLCDTVRKATVTTKEHPIASATILLIRHAAHGQLGQVLSGRTPNLPLVDAGRQQARTLALRVAAQHDLAAVQSGPLRRARETAAEIAGACGLPVQVIDALHEIDFGAWTARHFSELADDPLWQQWNSQRSTATAPDGESMVAAQERVLRHIRACPDTYPDQVVAMVTHCDIIRAAVSGVLGLSLDRILGFDVDPASVTRIIAGDGGERLISLNETAA